MKDETTAKQEPEKKVKRSYARMVIRKKEDADSIPKPEEPKGKGHMEYYFDRHCGTTLLDSINYHLNELNKRIDAACKYSSNKEVQYFKGPVEALTSSVHLLTGAVEEWKKEEKKQQKKKGKENV